MWQISVADTFQAEETAKAKCMRHYFRKQCGRNYVWKKVKEGKNKRRSQRK